jgi:hypothetical protein
MTCFLYQTLLLLAPTGARRDVSCSARQFTREVRHQGAEDRSHTTQNLLQMAIGLGTMKRPRCDWRIGARVNTQLGASQQWGHVRHLRRGAADRGGDSRGGYPDQRAAHPAGVDRTLAQGEHRRWRGELRAGRLLQLRGRREGALPRGDEGMDRGAHLEEARPRHCGGLGGWEDVGKRYN